MSETFGVLKTELAEALRDPNSRTFTDSDLGRMVNTALMEIGRILPLPFQEDITPTVDTLEYVLQSNEFGGDPQPEVEVMHVELWDGTTLPATRIAVIQPAHSEYTPDRESGWTNWGGTLTLPRRVWSAIDGLEDDRTIRVWGYAPYPELTDDDDVANISSTAKWALISRAQVEAYRRLHNERDLFSQWQTRSGNTDISPASLASMLNSAAEEWRRQSRALLRLRSAV